MSGELPKMTHSELAVMKLLWRMERASARELHDAIGPENDWSYSTTRTVVERMCKKGLVKKRDFHGLNLYLPAISRAAGLAGFVRRFAEQVLESDLAPVVSLLAQTKTMTPEELADLERLLDDDAMDVDRTNERGGDRK